MKFNILKKIRKLIRLKAMDIEKIDISTKPIKDFLDVADNVLNSNTFLLSFALKTNDIHTELQNFINSESFTQQLVNQDKEREWFNLHYFDFKTNTDKLKSGKIQTDKIELKIKEIKLEKEKNGYLIAMLTGDTTKGRFRSFYNQQIKTEKAKAIVTNLTSFLSVYEEWKLFIIEPDFLKNTIDKYPKDQELKYFENDFGNNTATLILSKNNGFLLLTNGID